MWELTKINLVEHLMLESAIDGPMFLNVVAPLYKNEIHPVHRHVVNGSFDIEIHECWCIVQH